MSCTELLDIVIVFVVIRIEMIVSLTLPALQYRHLAPPAMGHSALAMCPPPLQLAHVPFQYIQGNIVFVTIPAIV